MGILNLEMTYKTDTNRVFVSGIVPGSGKLSEKASKLNSTLRHDWNVRKLFFIDNNIYLPDSIATGFTFELLWNKEITRKYFIRVSEIRLTISFDRYVCSF